MSEFKHAKNGIFSPEEFPPDPDLIYECARSGRINAWGRDSESYLLGYIDATYTVMLALGTDESESANWMACATWAAVKGGERNLEISEHRMMMGDDEEV